MQSAVDLGGRPIHFIGVGGIGMSALAHILLKRQLPISGSDARANHITQKLESQGAQIFSRQEASNIQQLCQASSTPPQVICSTAIHEDNPEYQAAVQAGCPIFHRSDVLAALMQEFSQSIAIAGTHGKTTTSSLVGYLLLQASLDPTIIVGGEVAAWGGNARTGESPYLVAEADESDGSLVKFFPHIGVITNIELDHPDHYTSLDQVVSIFQQFVDHCHTLIVSVDCPTIADRFLALATDQSMITYSLSSKASADYTVQNIDYSGQGTIVEVLERGESLGQLELPLLGEHNLSNALAAVAVGRYVGLEFSAIAKALQTFSGAKRRFEIYGEAQGICLIDDYAHHPSEIQVTLASAKLQAQAAASTYSQSRVVAVFQPHRYSRAATFFQEFSQSFQDADLVVVTDIYSAGEANPGTINGKKLADAITANHSAVTFQPTLTKVIDFLQGHLQSGDVVLFLGAGDLNRIIPGLLAHFQVSSKPSPEVVLQ
ncbi:UDP-N-acetylmuramate--L-alanine ligase [Acaryochloris sp. CCMEE 5410]|uniref:UDP-N-acetylmuramate--L-alanine ligase n=1 Tax=Acaryochloris sp. CCMEE 5410 TaxID=310037 RepID=UPI000248474F|nr:UDP-N-acetylmuramate--L-alanine ligase [Acaryochloris sp. CCMEE 5410]KAI9131509.1 UDP-N-acetylmuramate--L-alanine ligase [Acaryochloris sp. CCMEE 5410]